MSRAFNHAILSSSLVIMSSLAQAKCEDNVDEVDFFYINGMMTTYELFGANLDAIKKFVGLHLGHVGMPENVTGAHNESEHFVAQILEVIDQKYTDWRASEKAAVHEFILSGGEFTKDVEGMAAVEKFLKEVGAAYYKNLGEEDAIEARLKLKYLLDKCSRVVMVTHSQGNFYGNMLMSWAYQQHMYPNGYYLRQYPMLSNIQLAAPTYEPGGSVAQIYPGVIGHVTLDKDLVMSLVRGTVGSAPANLEVPVNPHDRSGHGLVVSYLLPPGVASAISSQVESVIAHMEPYPLHGQRATGSMAFQGIGYSSVSQVLDLHFQTGGVYRYNGLSDGDFENFWGASSHGAHFNQYIRDQYPYARIEER